MLVHGSLSPKGPGTKMMRILNFCIGKHECGLDRVLLVQVLVPLELPSFFLLRTAKATSRMRSDMSTHLGVAVC